jgi:hypothetical protein
MTEQPEDPKYRIAPDGEPRVPMTGRVARMHNVTYVKPKGSEKFYHDICISETQYEPMRLDRNTPLFTFQDSFGTRGIRHYVDNPNQPTSEAFAETPQVYNTEDGRLWISEGHHRIIASRLRGEPYIDVHKMSTNWED